MGLRRHRPDGTPIVWGGNLYRAPNGLRAIHLTETSQRPTPDSVRDLYSRAACTTSPQEWNGQEVEGSLIIYFTDPIEFRCGRSGCAGALGRYVAYHAGTEYGIVPDTTHRYLDPQAKAVSVDPHDRLQPQRPQYRLTGNPVKSSAQTFANFRCRRCGHECARRIDRLGRALYEQQPATYLLE